MIYRTNQFGFLDKGRLEPEEVEEYLPLDTRIRNCSNPRCRRVIVSSDADLARFGVWFEKDEIQSFGLEVGGRPVCSRCARPSWRVRAEMPLHTGYDIPPVCVRGAGLRECFLEE